MLSFKDFMFTNHTHHTGEEGGGGRDSRVGMVAMLLVTRNSKTVRSTSDEATEFWRGCYVPACVPTPSAAKVGDEKYVTGKYPAGE